MPLDPPRADARRRRPSLPFALAGIAVLGAAGAAHAQMSPALDRFSLSVGAFSAKPEVSAAVGNRWGSLSTGDLDAGRKTLPRISGEFLIGDNHGISFEAFRYSQSYADQWGGVYTSGPFSAGLATGLSLDFDLDVARLGYRYWFGSGNTVVGLGAGIGYYRVSLETHAFASANAGLAGLGFAGYNGYYTRHDSDDAVAPMLEVGVRHAITPDLRLFLDGSGIHKGGGGGVRGSIYNATAGVEWFPLRNVGVSLAYAVTDVDLKRDDAGLQRLRLKFHGPVAAVKMRF
ncbi:hypothetical protein [Xenophilus sp.]|uniref:hypothetical protein n=1 Tax=Xenophilus sp. TaxID=1873499 RepID=UPI0037DC116B